MHSVVVGVRRKCWLQQQAAKGDVLPAGRGKRNQRGGEQQRDGERRENIRRRERRKTQRMEERIPG